MLCHQPPKPREAEHLAVGVMRLDNTVAVKEGAIADLQHDLLLLITSAGHEAQRHPPGYHLVSPAIMSPARKVVASVGVYKASALWVEEAIEAGDERARRYVRDQRLVDPRQDLPWRLQVLNDGSQHATGRRHYQRRRHTMAGSVSQNQPQVSVLQFQKVVEVAAHLPSRSVIGRYSPAL